ncbi:MAG: ADP-ribose pyrophosphatase [Methylothermaceae bacteria B42]|nr:MAG: ADP-ribose pyrophosphatase [Methylothermaceae bacteria B42]HHJ38985.1 NUDIX domain-containing protein [Methylothermaceae bacterium]
MTKKFEYQYQIVEEETVYQGFFNLLKIKLKHTLFHGGWSRVLTRELFQRGNCVAVVPYDPVTDQVVLIEQFRVGTLKNEDPKWMLEIVAGAIEAGETPEQVAIRELHEEAGCGSRKLKRVTEFYTSPGGSSEKITLFCAWVDASQAGGIHGLDDEDEDILVHVVSLDEAMAKVESGEINSGIPILGLQWLALHREQLRREWLD